MTETPHLQMTRIAYDSVAADYATLLEGELEAKPLDRALLTTFAERVATSGGGPVGDLGCGPGRVTAHLHSLGVDVFGIDLSPGMVEVARRSYPGLRFEEGTLRGLDLADESLAGVVAWYSIIHTPPDLMPVVLAELHRVLRPGGHLLLAFHVGDEPVHLEQGYGHTISLDVYRLSTERITSSLREAGIVVDAQLVREPTPPEKLRQAYLLGARPQ